MRISDRLHGYLWSSMTVNNCNTYLIDGPTRILIDPGHLRLFDHVTRGLETLKIGVSDIGLVICTHAHPDHIEAVRLFRENCTPVALHQAEWRMMEDMQAEIRAYFGLDVDDLRPDFLLTEGDLEVDGLRFEVIHTPGHSPGSICLHWPEEKALFTGDLVFRDGLGRTDLPGGDGALLKESIRRVARIGAARVLPGHGEIVSGQDAVRRNFEEIEQVWFAYV